MLPSLHEEVWALDRCSGCGACVAACSKGVLSWCDLETPRIEVREKRLGLSQLRLRTCEVCERDCEASCPRLVSVPPLRLRQATSARTAGVLRSSDPNDVARALLISALASELIDGVLMLDLDPWSMKPRARVANSVHSVTKGTGMQFLWAPVLSAMNEAIFELGLKRVAVVGTPCVSEAVRKVQDSEHPGLAPYRNALRFSISLFCTGVYMPLMIDELIETELNIPRQTIRGISTSLANQVMHISDWQGEVTDVDLSKASRFMRRGCSRCDDYLGLHADIALGALGAEQGYASMLTRTPQGQALIANAVDHGLLELVPSIDMEKLEAAQGEKDRRARAKAFDEFEILMLKALQEPKLTARVRQSYDVLYGKQDGSSRKRRVIHGNCGGC
jgi:coenzyme F420 hydrogenase subunit beta